MPNIASVLKEEIARITRKTIRAEIDILKKTGIHYRAEIAALKRRVVVLEQQARQRKETGSQRTTDPTVTPVKHRFSAKGLRSHHQRLKLSASECGVLLGVSAQTIYNWEAEHTRPRAGQLEAIAALKTLGLQAAQAIVAQRKARRQDA